MIAQKFIGALALIGGAVIFGSCKDMGDELKQSLTASAFSVSLSTGGTASVSISGGVPPYSISQQPDPALATAVLTNLPDRSGQLLIAATNNATASGTTQVRVKESGSGDSQFESPTSGEDEIVISVTVGAVPGVSFSGDVQPIFTSRCVNAGCHPGGGGPFSLQAGQSYNALVGVAVTTGACSGTFQRVRPLFADSSAIIRRLGGTTCGVQMPFGLSPLPQNEINVIRDWINQGAANN